MVGALTVTTTSPQRSKTKKPKPRSGVVSNVSVSVVGPNRSTDSSSSSDPTSVVLERRLFSARTTKRLDLSVASHTTSERLPHVHTTPLLQIFPRTILTHELTSGHCLRELWLTNHRLAVLPPDIAVFTQLRVLGLAGNALATLPPEIAQLSALEALYLERNDLRVIADDVVFPRQLRDLRLDHNALSDVPLQLTQLRLLQRLGLSYNRLTRLPQELKRLMNLVELDLDHNEITTDGFPNDAIARLQHLERLGLDGNWLSERPACLLRMPQVRYVRLNGNRAPASKGTDDASDQDTTSHVPRRHDGYYQCVQGYQAVKALSTVESPSFTKTIAAPLDGLVPARDQNLLNSMTYRRAVPMSQPPDSSTHASRP